MRTCEHEGCYEPAQEPSPYCRVHRHEPGTLARAWAELEQAFLQATLPIANRFLRWLNDRLAARR